MKNLPEESNSLEHRLRDYSETPPELAWENIQARLQQDDDSSGLVWRNRTAAVAIIAFLSWFTFNTFPTFSVQPDQTTFATAPSTTQQSKEVKNSLGDVADLKSHEQRSKNSSLNKPAQGLLSESNISANEEKFQPGISAGARNVSSQRLIASQKADEQISSSVVGDKENASSQNVMSPERFKASAQQPEENVTDSLKNIATSIILPKKEKHDSVAVVNRAVVPRKNGRPITFYAFLTPSFSFLSVTPKQHDAFVVQQFENPSIMSVQRLGLSFDVGLQGTLVGRLGYVAGLSLYYQNQSYSYSGVRTDKTTFNEQTLTYDPVPFRQNFNYTMFNGGFQGGLMYTLIESPLKHRIGVTFQYQQGLYHSEGSYNNAASHYFNYQVFYRIELSAGSRTGFILQPAFTAPINFQESISAPFTLKNFRAGIGIGLSFKVNDPGKLRTLKPNQSNR